MSDIRVSSHALERWLERSDATLTDPADAWVAGVPVPVHPTDLQAHEVRYHDDSGTLLLRKNRTIVTVLHVRSVSPDTRRAVLEVTGGVSA